MRTTKYLKSARGFSIVELLVASALTIGVAAVVFAAVASSESTFAVQTEAADVQQRLRVAVTALRLDLEATGAGPTVGPYAGSLAGALAAVLPYEIGSAPGTPRRDVLTLIAVPQTFAQTTLAQPFTAGSTATVVQLEPGCPLGSEACGLAPGMNVVVFDGSGAFDLFRVRSVSGLTVSLEASDVRSGHVYLPGSAIVEIQVHTFLRETDSEGVGRLVRRSGIGGSAVPVADHVVGLEFDLLADPLPPRIVPAPAERPQTTYGLRPPPGTEQLPGHRPGENCLFSYVEGIHVSRLSALAADEGSLTTLRESQLADGPWCPDSLHPLRFDADLLRVRRVSLRLRVESALDALRGQAASLFARPGTNQDVRRSLPDVEASLSVSPLNLLLSTP